MSWCFCTVGQRFISWFKVFVFSLLFLFLAPFVFSVAHGRPTAFYWHKFICSWNRYSVLNNAIFPPCRYENVEIILLQHAPVILAYNRILTEKEAQRAKRKMKMLAPSICYINTHCASLDQILPLVYACGMYSHSHFYVCILQFAWNLYA